MLCDAVISLTTIPSRAPHIGPVLESLASQGPKVYLWLQRKLFKSADEVPAVAGVEVGFTDVFGPAAKLIPALGLGADTVITADDDRVYPERWAKRLILARFAFPFAAFCYSGRRLAPSLVYSECEKAMPGSGIVGVDMPIGFAGAAYSPSFFGSDFGSMVEKAVWNDDLPISASLREQGVPLYAVPLSGTLRQVDTGIGRLDLVDNLSEKNVNGRRNDSYLKALFGNGVAEEVSNG